MPNLGAIQAGKAFIKLTINDSEFQRGLTGSIRRLDTFGRSLISIGSRFALAGTAFATPFIAAIKAFSTKGGTAARELNIALDSLGNSASKTGQAIGQALAPSVIAFSNAVSNMLPDILQWISANKALVVGIPLITTGVTALAIAVTGLGVALRGLALIAGSAKFLALLAFAHPLITIASLLAAAVAGAAALGLKFNPKFNTPAPTPAPPKPRTPLLDTLNEVGGLEEGFEEGAAFSAANRRFRRRPAARIDPLSLPLTGGNVLLKVFDELRQGKGLPGFSTQRRDPELESFTRGTFQGRLAGQIFGGSNSRNAERQLREQEQMRKRLESIDQKIGIGPAHKIGIA